MTRARLRQRRKTGPVGQARVEQNQRDVRMLLEETRGLAPTRGLQDRRAGIELPYDATQRLTYQHVVVNQEKLHR